MKLSRDFNFLSKISSYFKNYLPFINKFKFIPIMVLDDSYIRIEKKELFQLIAKRRPKFIFVTGFWIKLPSTWLP
jgi:hypothetical protein